MLNPFNIVFIDPSYTIVNLFADPATIEAAGRTCYRSECQGDPEKFVRMVRDRGHESVLEHSLITVRFVVNRGITHEQVRHRIASFSQESTRYVNYDNKGFRFIRPEWASEGVLGGYTVIPCEDQLEWRIKRTTEGEHVHARRTNAERRFIYNAAGAAFDYLSALDDPGNPLRPEQARDMLPHSLAAEIVISANAREWRHVFELRTALAAHPEMRRVMRPLLLELQKSPAGCLFDDIAIKGV